MQLEQKVSWNKKWAHLRQLGDGAQSRSQPVTMTLEWFREAPLVLYTAGWAVVQRDMTTAAKPAACSRATCRKK